MATTRRAPEGAAVKKDKSAKNLIPAVSYSMADIMNNPSGVRTRSGDGKYKGKHGGGGAAPSNHKRHVTHAQHRAKNPRQPARKRQELDLTPFQDQPSQYGSASSRDRIRGEVEGWWKAEPAARPALAQQWGLGKKAREWLDKDIGNPPFDFRGYLRARAQDAMADLVAGKPVFKDIVSRPAATKILGVWQGAERPAPKAASPAKRPVQTPAPKLPPPRPVPAQAPRPVQAPAKPVSPPRPVQPPAPKLPPPLPPCPTPSPSVPVVLATRIPKSERGAVARALEAAFREVEMSAEGKRAYALIIKERHGILVTFD